MAYQSAPYTHSSEADEYTLRDGPMQAPMTSPPDWDPEALGQALLTDQSDWSAVTNLDQFFCKVYTYYVEKGFWCMIAARVTNLITLAFTICFSTFLLLFVNWHSLILCNSDTSCEDVVTLRKDVLSHPSTLESLVIIYFAVFCVFWLWNLLSFVYTLRDALEMRTFYKEDLRIEDDDLVSLEWHFILESLVSVSARKKLCIVKDLTALDITNRIMRKENFMIAMINLDLFQFGPRDAHGAWNLHCCAGSRRRRGNTQEMQEPRKVLRERGTRGGINSAPAGSPPPLSSPPPGRALKDPLLHDGIHMPRVHTTSISVAPSYSTFLSPTAAAATAAAGTPATAVGPSPSAAAKSLDSSSWWPWAAMGTTLDWNIRFCVLHSLFDSHFSIHPSYLGPSGVTALKARFVALGVANLLLMPFIMLFMTIFFILKHAEELHSKKTLFGPRQWCKLAQWKLREFNELPHFFERRLTLSSVAAQQYMHQFPNTLVSIIAQSVAYIAGALVAVLLLLTVTDSDVISHRILDRPLLWHLAVFSAILALSRSMIPDKTIYPAPALVMAEVIKHTHYAPAHWRGRTHTGPVHREFTYMYPSRLSVFLFEIMSVVATPFVLLFCLPQSAERIVQFVSARTVHVQGVGHLCSYAMFDIEKHGDARYSHIPPSLTATEQRDGKEASLTSGYRAPSTSGLQRQGSSTAPAPPSFPLRLNNGKMEKSFLAFSMANPHWKPVSGEDGGSGAKFLSSLADSLYGPPPSDSTSTLQMSRDGSEHEPPKRFRASASVRFAGVGDASSSKLPEVSGPMTRQDSLDSNTTDEGFDTEMPEHLDEADAQAKSTASYVLSQSDRHLIQSFADLVGLDPNMQSTLHPSTMMRQSSLGGGAGSLIGMSTVLGLNQRRAPHSSPHRGGGGGVGGGPMQQSHMLRSHMATSSMYHPTNSVLLNSALLPRGGGLQGGISASTMLHLDAQSMREQLMLAQADQQADLFALLESRLEEESPVDEGDEEEASEREPDEDEDDNSMPRGPSHPFPQPSSSSTPQRGVELPPFQQQSVEHNSFSTGVKPASFDARQYSSATPPTAYALSNAASASHTPPDDNEPPPMSFFN